MSVFRIFLELLKSILYALNVKQVLITVIECYANIFFINKFMFGKVINNQVDKFLGPPFAERLETLYFRLIPHSDIRYSLITTNIETIHFHWKRYRLL